MPLLGTNLLGFVLLVWLNGQKQTSKKEGKKSADWSFQRSKLDKRNTCIEGIALIPKWNSYEASCIVKFILCYTGV